MKAAHRHVNNRVRLAAIFVCCLTAAHLPAQIIGGGGIRVGRRQDRTSAASKVAGALAKEGPRFLAVYALTDFVAEVFVREAPMVVEYRLGDQCTATVTVRATVDGQPKTFPQTLPTTGGEVRQVSFRLPPEFGRKAVAGQFAVKVENCERADDELTDFELLGFCMGEKGCGSIGIDRLSFQPDRVRAAMKEQVDYSFYSRSDFEKARAEFLVLERAPGGQPRNRRVKAEGLSGLRRGASFGKRWNGKDQKGKVSIGRHRLFVKAWNPEKKGGDWASAISRQRVTIE